MDETKIRLSGSDRVEHVRRGVHLGAISSIACTVLMLSANAHAQGPASAPPVDSAAVPPVQPPAALPAENVPPPPPPVAPAPVVSVQTAPPPVLIAPAAPPPPAAPPVAPPASAAPLWTPVFTGSFFTRYELRSGFDDLGLSSATARQRFLEGDSFVYRARFGMGTGLFDVGSGLKVGLQFTPQTTGTFGNLTNSPSAPNTTVDASMGLHEGYLRVQGKYTRLDSGRFELNYGDALVVGNLDWNEIGRSFDGVRARISSSPTSAWLDLFATMLDEGRTDFLRGASYLDQSPGIGAGDVYFLGAYAALGPAITQGLDLDAYALVRTWSDAKNLRVAPANAMSPLYRRENAADATIGVRAKQKLGFFDYRLEAGLQAGSRPGVVPAMAMPPPTKVDHVDVLAHQADLELGLSYADKFRVGVEGIYASGDDPETKDKNEGWDELYPTAHKFLGLSDAFVQNGSKRTNVLSGVLHLTATPTKSLTLQVDGHLFSRIEKAASTNNQDGFAGGEVDVGAVLVLGKGLKLRGTYAIFYPNTGIYKDVLPTPAVAKSADPVQFAELELRYDLMP